MITAPIVLFVYNRPWHTRQALEALAKNNLAAESRLYIYADGPKPDADENTLTQIRETRDCIKSSQWCKEVIIKKRETNLGLAESMIKGVTEIINEHERIIVLEDDLVTEIGFLKYMNDALFFYSKDQRVGCIHAWNYDLDTTDYPESTFFLRGADCWGWATWKRGWDIFNQDGKYLLNAVRSEKKEDKFNRNGTYPFFEMLKDQVDGKNDSWAIRWHASLFLAGKYCLQPTKAIVKNIGLDNSGVHCAESDIPQSTVENIIVNKIPVRENQWFFKAYNEYFQKINKMSNKNRWQRLRTSLKNLYHQ